MMDANLVRTCLICGEKVKGWQKRPKKIYCSRKHLLNNFGGHNTIRLLRRKVQDPIYQVNQLSLIELESIKVYTNFVKRFYF